MWKTGHSFIKDKMRQTKALLAGEMSGHIFFSDKYFGFDDALYASIRLLKILSKNKNITKLLTPFSKLISTPEIKIFCEDSIKFNIMKKLKTEILKKHSNIDTIDGIRVNNKKGWWLIRASNTQPALIVRCEAESQNYLNVLIVEVKELLEKYNIQISASHVGGNLADLTQADDEKSGLENIINVLTELGIKKLVYSGLNVTEDEALNAEIHQIKEFSERCGGIFDEIDEKFWTSFLSDKGGKNKIFSNYPKDPSLN